MKHIRKKLIGMVMAMMFCFAPVSAWAAEMPVTISSGLNMAAKEVECTFENNRVVYGEAAPGTKIVFTVSKMNRFGGMVTLHQRAVTVGSMGLFSVNLPLDRGNNYISMTADGAKQQVVIKQVPQKVKKQLQSMIALPGLNTVRK